MLTRLILVNAIVFVLIRLMAVGTWAFGSNSLAVIQWVAMPSDLWLLLKRPWTLLTYMFAHADLLHILFNMLWLYWIGSIFMEFFSAKHLSGLYLLGGWGGAALYLVAANLMPNLAGGVLMGASAAVIAVVVATAVYVPDYKIRLLFLGEVAIKWVAIVTVAIALLSLDGGNVGGNVAHIGGALVGAWFALRIKQGRDITRPINSFIDAMMGLFNGRKFRFPDFKSTTGRKRQTGSGTQHSAANQPDDMVSEEELDRILDKIKAAGYDALTDEERDKLFKVSRRR